MKDYRAHLEALRKEAAECVLICDQTTVGKARTVREARSAFAQTGGRGGARNGRSK